MRSLSNLYRAVQDRLFQTDIEVYWGALEELYRLGLAAGLAREQVISNLKLD